MIVVSAILTSICLLVGGAFAIVGALGILRFPDVYTRMHAASKAGTLGSGFCLLAVAVWETDLDVTTRAIAGVFFFLLTAPISAHLLARAALIAGYSPISGAGRGDVSSALLATAEANEAARLKEHPES
ncbi:monovalent cation/H(+) antiporter subunit G [Chthonobacter rhizosphaerae]|uniref:monovalent cation/H(+) antiporter subunit G n=1 Tax=Chthonobacter rhizosphaerae TaxID=2735553 RepID=UPI0015EF0F23|nr:monovalent cation/H(+) antiporter subunit G [Chthonobacter rhizosphaerae]